MPSSPVVVVVPDHLGRDARVDYYAAPLLEAGICVLVLKLPSASGIDEWSRLLPQAPNRPGAAEAILPDLFAALRDLSGKAEMPEGQSRPIGVLGFGIGAEAAALAGHAVVASAFLAPGQPRFRAHALLYPTCAGPTFHALRRVGAATTGAPIMAILPHAGGAGDMPGGCAMLFDHTGPIGQDPFQVWWYDSLGYAFDLWTATAMSEDRSIHPHSFDPLRFDALRADMARAEVTRLFIAALRPGPFGASAPRAATDQPAR